MGTKMLLTHIIYFLGGMGAIYTSQSTLSLIKAVFPLGNLLLDLCRHFTSPAGHDIIDRIIMSTRE